MITTHENHQISVLGDTVDRFKTETSYGGASNEDFQEVNRRVYRCSSQRDQYCHTPVFPEISFLSSSATSCESVSRVQIEVMSRDVESRGVKRMGTGDIYGDVSLVSVITEAERVSGSAVSVWSPRAFRAASVMQGATGWFFGIYECENGKWSSGMPIMRMSDQW